MPTASQYARYRQDRTTIWVSKSAFSFLSREREHPTESVGTVLDRLLTELRRTRRGASGSAGARGAGAAKKGAAKKGAAKKGAKRARRTA
jgi:hypothetical protein